MYFSSGSPYPAMALGALKGLVDLGHKKQAIIYCVEAEQCAAWRDIAKAKAAAYGVDIVYEAQVSLAQPDFTAECIAGPAQRRDRRSTRPSTARPSPAWPGPAPSRATSRSTWASAWPSSTPSPTNRRWKA